LSKKVIIWIGILVACWQTAVKTDAAPSKELSSTLSAIHQGVPPFCEEITTSYLSVVSLQNLASCSTIASFSTQIFVKWLRCGTFILDVNRYHFVSIFLFPFHSFF
jgi:hypothetical protein